MSCRKSVTYFTLSSSSWYLCEVCFNLVLCGPEKIKNCNQFYEIEVTSEKWDKVAGKDL